MLAAVREALMIANSPLPPRIAGGLVSQRLADPLRRRLVDEEIAGVGVGVGVPGDHLDAAVAGLAQHRRDAFLIFDGDGDDVHAAGDPRFDDLVLLCGVRIGRAVPDQIDAQFLGRLLRALAAGDEIGVALGSWASSPR